MQSDSFPWMWVFPKLEKLKEEDLDFLCESAAADACAPGNPRPANLEQFREMFKKLM